MNVSGDTSNSSDNFKNQEDYGFTASFSIAPTVINDIIRKKLMKMKL